MRRKRIIAAILSGILLAGVLSERVKTFQLVAGETAEFYVQTAAVDKEGTMTVSVYLENISNMGGISAQLTYDPAKVTYVESGIGKAFENGYGETYCNEDTAVIKCVSVYAEPLNKGGELMYAVFKSNGLESYQPEFQVLDLLDSSEEIRPISYIIRYQQADGTWTDVQDTSGQKADDNIIEETRQIYGWTADKAVMLQELDGEQDLDMDPDTAQVMQSEEEQITEKAAGEEESATEELQTRDEIQEVAIKGMTEAASEEKDDTQQGAVIVTIIVLIAAILCLVFLKIRMKNRKRRRKKF